MSNYPPGVTGFEPEIAGPVDEYDTTESVRGFEYCESAPDEYIDVQGTMTVWGLYDAVFEWECTFCRQTHTKDTNELED